MKPLIITGFLPRIAPSSEEVESWPKNISEVVNDLLAAMSKSFKNEVRSKKKKDLIQYHLNWGMVFVMLVVYGEVMMIFLNRPVANPVILILHQ